MEKVVFFNVKYSPNLGDGVIAITQEELASRYGLEHETFDLAGRCEHRFSQKKGIRELFIKLSPIIPRFARLALVRANVNRIVSQNASQWKRGVAESDYIVIGGGNVFSDVDLNFPLKISSVLRVCKESNKKASVFSVGVADGWSKEGLDLICEEKENFGDVFVRDGNSKRNFLNFDLTSCEVMPDPAVLVSDFFPRKGRTGSGCKVGVNLACPDNLRYSGDFSISTSESSLLGKYKNLVDILISKDDCEVVLFTNGANEDEAFKDTLLKKLKGYSGKVVSLPRPESPHELIANISGFDRVVSYRLHACIIAYSYGIPCVGIAWDSKVKSFFEEYVGADWCINDLAELQDVDLFLQGYQFKKEVSDAKQQVKQCFEHLLGKVSVK